MHLRASIWQKKSKKGGGTKEACCKIVWEMGNGEWNHDGCNIGSITSVSWQRSEVVLDAGKFNDPSRTNDWSKSSWKAIISHVKKLFMGNETIVRILHFLIMNTLPHLAQAIRLLGFKVL